MNLKMYDDSRMRVILIGLIFLNTFTLQEIREAKFVQYEVCGSEEDLIRSGCTTPSTVMSNLRCAAECTRDSLCLGSFVDKERRCHFLRMCPFAWNPNCDPRTADHVFKIPRKKCHHGGKFTRVANTSCNCGNTDGYVGNYCGTRAKSCQELEVNYGYKLGVTYSVKLRLKKRNLRVSCRNDQDAWMVGLFSNSGSYNHSRSWLDYKRGFYTSKNDYWLGLETMHELSTSYDGNVAELIFYFAYETAEGEGYKNSDVVYYHGFRVQDESSGYANAYDRFQVENEPSFRGVETPMADCLRDIENIPFSTWDRDGDNEQEINCAKMASTGWWFKYCKKAFVCNPMGMSVKKLPETFPYGHIALPDLNMTSSAYGAQFRRLEMKLYIFKP